MGNEESPYRTGQFVRCNFPYKEKPIEPGPSEHIAYIFGSAITAKKQRVIICIYTTSQPWKKSETLPLGVLRIPNELAEKLGQKPFTLDARRIGFLPPNEQFFKHINTPTRGILREVASNRLQKIIENQVAIVGKRPEYRVFLGPLRPRESPEI
jgi:hypothetical protein